MFTIERLIPYRRILIMASHVGLGMLAYVLAYLLRFEFSIPPEWLKLFFGTILIAGLAKGLCGYLCGLTSGLMRYVGISDLLATIKAATLSSLLLLLYVVLVFGHSFPRSIFVLDWLLTIMLIGGVSLSFRIFRERLRNTLRRTSGRRTLIIGAGDTGDATLRAIQKDFIGTYNVVGLLDDDPQKLGMTLHGIPVVGTIDQASVKVKEFEASEVIVAIANVSKPRLRQIVDNCAKHNLHFQLVPAITDLITGKVEVQRLRSVEVEDLLGRDPISLNKEPVRADLSGKCILVTGAGGSIGSELARQIASFGPGQLLLMDVAESPLFEIDRELAERYPQMCRKALMVDMRQADVVDQLFAQYKPERVYHAAAYKHVPLMEAHPVDAVLNNVLGTRNLVKAAIAHQTDKFLMISTDKAVRPSSIMGATKRCAELLLTHHSEVGNTHFVAVRFGNVLGSNGSVIPIFRKQIEKGGPITVTHPEITRYFMTIPEAVELVLQANTIGHGGELFMLEMGEPVKIVDLARAMIELSGLTVGEDIKIEFSGLRPGEKLYEELAYNNEDVSPTGIPKLLVHRTDGELSPAFPTHFAALEQAALRRNQQETLALLWRIVREHLATPDPKNK